MSGAPFRFGKQSKLLELPPAYEIEDLADYLALDRGSLGYPGATDMQIKALEDRLEVILPPSYKAFLQASNGWLQLDMDQGESGRIWSTAEVDWFQLQCPEWVKDLHDYSMPVGQGQYRHVKSLVAISEGTDLVIYLLNPKAVTPDGEWEAWRLDEIRGARVFPSFEDLMRAEHARIEARTRSPSLTPHYSYGFTRATRKDPEVAATVQSIKQMVRPGDRAAMTALIDRLAHTPQDPLRALIAEALGHMQLADATETLVELFVPQGNQRKVQAFLSDVLGETSVGSAPWAAGDALIKVGDERALDAAKEGLKYQKYMLRIISLRLLGKFKVASTVSLVAEFLKDPEEIVQSQAAMTLMQIRSREAAQHLLRHFKTETDVGLRWHLARCLEPFTFTDIVDDFVAATRSETDRVIIGVAERMAASMNS